MGDNKKTKLEKPLKYENMVVKYCIRCGMDKPGIKKGFSRKNT